MTWNYCTSVTLRDDFVIGQEFASLTELKNFLKPWSLSQNHNFDVIESDLSKHVIKNYAVLNSK